MVPRIGKPLILGGPESEPFVKQDSAVKETRNLPVFMVPDEGYPNARIIDFTELFDEISSGKRVKRVGIVGSDQMPVSVYNQITSNFRGVELVDITEMKAMNEEKGRSNWVFCDGDWPSTGEKEPFGHEALMVVNLNMETMGESL